MRTLESYRNHLREIYKLSSAISLLEWDQETTLQDKGMKARGEAIGYLTRRAFDLKMAPELGEWIENLEQDPELSSEVAGSVRFHGMEYRRKRAIPPRLVEEHAVVRSQAQAVWAKARQTSDFKLFLPHLKKMVEFARRFADLYGFEDHPYDALLEEYEPGMTATRLISIMRPLQEDLCSLLRKLPLGEAAQDESLLKGSFCVEKQRQLSRIVLKTIGYDFEAGALHDVEHPFTVAIASGDVRVTNQYDEAYLPYGLYGALHEGGHALYHQGMPEELYELGLQEGSSGGIDEAQALIMENQLGRSLPFWRFFQPLLASVFGEFGEASPEEIYRAVNVVSPSLVRLEADELTYNLHIMLRVELEIGLIGGQIKPQELPDLWNEAMDRYLEVTPPSDKLGVLQDIHWAAGYYGYFPTYLLGTLYASQLAASMKRELTDIDESVEHGEICAFVDWLRRKVHRFGGVYEPDELILRATGEGLSANHFMRYITDKYSDIYGVAEGSEKGP